MKQSILVNIFKISDKAGKKCNVTAFNDVFGHLSVKMSGFLFIFVADKLLKQFSFGTVLFSFGTLFF